ncbi:hypothetical protein [Billgrantia kenyensis]|uniref:hypothetical protein n=1 Tax=Billgrantia kenyensis TaxID=321266 RepID=UPI003BEEDC60
MRRLRPRATGRACPATPPEGAPVHRHTGLRGRGTHAHPGQAGEPSGQENSGLPGRLRTAGRRPGNPRPAAEDRAGRCLGRGTPARRTPGHAGDQKRLGPRPGQPQGDSVPLLGHPRAHRPGAARRALHRNGRPR